jgi:hypothetical protein
MVKDKMNSEIEEENTPENEEESIESSTEKEEESTDEQKDVSENTIEDIKPPSKIKKLYREIVKQTHPDKVKNKKLNGLYLVATKAYEQDDLLKIYAVCSELDIEYEIEDIDYQNIVNRISMLKDRINFLESTYTWKWHHSQDPKEKENIILKYISSQLKN